MESAPTMLGANIAAAHFVFRRGGFHIRPPKHTDTLSVTLSASIPAFLCRKEAQRKAIKRNAKGETRKRGLFEKSPLLTPAKTFRQMVPECWACAPKATRQPVSRTAGAREVLPGCQSSCCTRRRASTNALVAATVRIYARSRIGETDRRRQVVPAAVATARYTVPTGSLSVPPPGPA